MTQHSSTANAARTMIVAPLTALALLTAAGCGGGGSDSPEGSVPPPTTASTDAPSESESSGDESTAAGESGEADPHPTPSGDNAGDGGDGSGDGAGSGGGAGDGDASNPRGDNGSHDGGGASSSTLAGTDPCELLTEKQREEVGLPRTTANEESGKSRSCELNPPAGSGPSTSALIALHEDEGLAAFSGMTGEAKRITISEHDAKIQCDYGNCLIGLAVTEKSRVDIQSTVLGDDAATEKLGKRIARMVIGNLSSV